MRDNLDFRNEFSFPSKFYKGVYWIVREFCFFELFFRGEGIHMIVYPWFSIRYYLLFFVYRNRIGKSNKHFD